MDLVNRPGPPLKNKDSAQRAPIRTGQHSVVPGAGASFILDTGLVVPRVNELSRAVRGKYSTIFMPRWWRERHVLLDKLKLNWSFLRCPLFSTFGLKKCGQK